MTEQQELLALYDKLMEIHKVKMVIESCELMGGLLSGDTKAFIQSVKAYFESNGYISDKQLNSLREISERDYQGWEGW